MNVITSESAGLEIALITANVGSIFENPHDLLDQWITCFSESVLMSTNGKKTQFVALHCQEVGGKSFGTSMGFVEQFSRRLAENLKKAGFLLHLTFVDKASPENIEEFTALANMYFIHESLIDNILLWNFNTSAFEPISESRTYNNEDLGSVPFVHKQKFTPEMTPMQKSARKGFLRTRWKMTGIESESLELVNVHLFHDESNIKAMETFPSIYASSRLKALRFTLEQIGLDRSRRTEGAEQMKDRNIAFFIFGDFNFRLNVGAVVSWLSEGAELTETRSESKEVTRKEFCRKSKPSPSIPESSCKVLALERKVFDIDRITCSNILNCDLTRTKLLSYDKELELFNGDLHENSLRFPPSYPYSEKVSQATEFSGTRCPSWCDRILYNSAAAKMILKARQYDLIGEQICMGDHKPVILRISLEPTSAKSGTAHHAVNEKLTLNRVNGKPNKGESDVTDAEGPVKCDEDSRACNLGKKIANNIVDDDESGNNQDKGNEQPKVRIPRRSTTKCCPKPKHCVLL